MSSHVLILIVVLALVVFAIAVVTGLVLARRRRIKLDQRRASPAERQGYRAGGGISLAPGGDPRTAPPPPAGERPEVDGEPAVGEDAAVPRDAPRRDILDVSLPGGTTTAEPAERQEPPTDAVAPEAPAEVVPDVSAPAAATEAVPVPDTVSVPGRVAEPVEEIAPPAGRLERLRGRLSRSRSALGQGLLGLLGAGDLDEDSWEEVEDTLLLADLGGATTTEIVERLRERLASRAVRDAEGARAVLRDVLIDALHPDMDRSVRALPHQGAPAVVLIVGVNGTGKTTTVGKLARVLVAEGHKVLLGAADTFRAAAVEQLTTWGERVGAETVRGREGADPAAVAFDAVKRGVESGVDAVLLDTAGRLHTKTGLMDELGKVKRVVEKQAEVDEVLLVLDATTGQNGLTQARVFSEVVDVTGIVLTKLDGTAKGGIVFQVQRELGVPVKLVGLGEGADDLAPFEPAAFVDALLG
ncbi:signal recognition particle-docking protein FtsY [Gandjariella thermophila]|uniref:Signal recognition particle receptor FtsY n=1 Tax=Gandjariella thermophila TaxID=1931992 RepID=A0A4D4J594_9PSEU|nr:signal recognition particle-docking protein FtsY [Gandjariella thermophila]GDY30634.1 signal recognition particle receptor FtsY [Gandjariella thermophila]